MEEVGDGELLEIIKEGQNLFGEMDEKDFGRSAGITSGIRLFRLAPGFAEGNLRTIGKAVFQGKHATRSLINIVMTLATSAIIAEIGTRIMTGHWIPLPDDPRDFADMFKIHTGKVDPATGEEILIETGTTAKDYRDFAGFLLRVGTGEPYAASKDYATRLMDRATGMMSPVFVIVTDLAAAGTGKIPQDWRGRPIWQDHHTEEEKALHLAAHWGLELEPIPVSVTRQGMAKGMNVVQASLVAMTGVRPTFSERVKRVWRGETPEAELSRQVRNAVYGHAERWRKGEGKPWNEFIVEMDGLYNGSAQAIPDLDRARFNRLFLDKLRGAQDSYAKKFFSAVRTNDKQAGVKFARVCMRGLGLTTESLKRRVASRAAKEEDPLAQWWQKLTDEQVQRAGQWWMEAAKAPSE